MRKCNGHVIPLMRRIVRNLNGSAETAGLSANELSHRSTQSTASQPHYPDAWKITRFVALLKSANLKHSSWSFKFCHQSGENVEALFLPIAPALNSCPIELAWFFVWIDLNAYVMKLDGAFISSMRCRFAPPWYHTNDFMNWKVRTSSLGSLAGLL